MSYEPMDVDLSTHSNSAMDISYGSSSINNDENAPTSLPRASSPPLLPEITVRSPQPTNIKKFHINRKKERKTKLVVSTKTKIACSVFIALLSVMIYQVMSIRCSGDINSDMLKNNLSSKLFGQTQAINNLIESLNLDEKSKILFFYGGTGVGKTFTASLIMEQIGHYSNVYHYVMPGFVHTFSSDFMIGLSVCKNSIVIVDDLSAKDININIQIKDLIMKSQNLNKDLTVILIYNCDNAAEEFEKKCDNKFLEKLLHEFRYIDAFKKLIEFQPLNEDHLRQCIETELGSNRFRNADIEKILKNFNVSLDGCKGVYTKIKMLEIS